MEDEDEVVGTRGDWLHHPYTQRTVKDLKTVAERQLAELLGICEKTEDARVAAAHARYQQTLVHQRFYTARGPS